MKTRVLTLFLTVLLLMLCAACALAAPELTGVFASDSGLVIGNEGWSFDFTASEGGRLAMELLSGETGEVIAALGAADIQAGAGRLGWDGLLPDGIPILRINRRLLLQYQ
ncbi:MAG: hypothetical protein ACI4NI_07035 [Candidatus Ornithospirochaeta sp.]